MKNSEVVQALANIASQGKYTVDPRGANNMNRIFQEVARVINELEEQEREEEGADYEDTDSQ